MGTLVAQQPTNQASVVDETEKKVLEAIPITEITFRADETTSLLSKIQADAEPKPSIISIEEGLPKHLDSLNTLHMNPILKDFSSLNVRVLQNLSQEWTLYYKQLEDFKKTLQIRTQDLEVQGHDLKAMTDIWLFMLY
jgi:hypothetical protein